MSQLHRGEWLNSTTQAADSADMRPVLASPALGRQIRRWVAVAVFSVVLTGCGSGPGGTGGAGGTGAASLEPPVTIAEPATTTPTTKMEAPTTTAVTTTAPPTTRPTTTLPRPTTTVTVAVAATDPPPVPTIPYIPPPVPGQLVNCASLSAQHQQQLLAIDAHISLLGLIDTTLRLQLLSTEDSRYAAALAAAGCLR